MNVCIYKEDMLTSTNKVAKNTTKHNQKKKSQEK